MQSNTLRTIILSSLTAAVLFLNGCSVGMALSGQKEPDMSVVKVGANRIDVETQLGAPVQATQLANGDTSALYQYQTGNEPSAGRAIAHGAMDVMTLGLWEVIGTPIELSTDNMRAVSIVYNPANEVTSVTCTQPKTTTTPSNNTAAKSTPPRVAQSR